MLSPSRGYLTYHLVSELLWIKYWTGKLAALELNNLKKDTKTQYDKYKRICRTLPADRYMPNFIKEINATKQSGRA